MKLLEHTISVLKNFQRINSSIILQKGNILSSMSEGEDIMAYAILDDSFPEDFEIYDLSRFLGNLSTMNNPELEFTNEYVKLKDSSTGIILKYHATEQGTVKGAPKETDLEVENFDVSFDISSETFSRIIKIADMNRLPNIIVRSDNGWCIIEAANNSDDTTNTASFKIKETDQNFKVVFNKDNLKFIEDDYSVDILTSTFGRFKAKNKKLTYYVGIESE